MRSKLSVGSRSTPGSSSGKSKKKTKKLSGENFRVCSQADKDVCLQKLKSLLGAGGLIGRDIYAGFNSTMKQVEKKVASVVCCFRDTPKIMMQAMSNACVSTRAPLVLLPRASQEFAAMCSLKQMSCFCVTVVRDHTSSDRDVVDALLDDLQETLITLSRQPPNSFPLG